MNYINECSRSTTASNVTFKGKTLEHFLRQSHTIDIFYDIWLSCTCLILLPARLVYHSICLIHNYITKITNLLTVNESTNTITKPAWCQLIQLLLNLMRKLHCYAELALTFWYSYTKCIHGLVAPDVSRHLIPKISPSRHCTSLNVLQHPCRNQNLGLHPEKFHPSVNPSYNNTVEPSPRVHSEIIYPRRI